MRKAFQILLHLFVLLCIYQVAQINASKTIKFRTAHAKYSKDYFTNLTLLAKNGSIHLDMDLIKPLTNGFHAKMDIQLSLSNTKKYQTLFSYDIEVCRMIIALKDNMLKKWYMSVMKYGNFMQNCPVNSGHYYLKGWHLDDALIPSYLYAGDYRVKVLGYYGKRNTKSYAMVVDLEVEAKSEGLKFRSARSKYSRNYFSNFTLYTKNDAIYIDMNVIKPLVIGFKALLDIQLRIPNSKRYQTLISYDVDVCRTVIALKDNLLKRWFRSLLKFGNFMENCPVGRGHYYLNGWFMNASLVPTYLYVGDYRVKCLAYFGRRKTKSYDMVVDLEVDTKIV